MSELDLLDFADEAPPEMALGPADDAWRVLVVDDDPDVHESTRYGLQGIVVEGRPLQLLHAHSAAQAVAMLRCERNIAVILLDVVMETEDAGLQTVATIRGELGLAHVRIVLRTGQPGSAPEIETIQRYDINDYRTKSELTRTKLFVTLTTALRAYDQLRRLEASRRGLEKIIEASNQLMAEHGLHAFAEGVITQIASLVGVAPEGLVCASRRAATAALPSEYVVVAAAGAFAPLINHSIDDVADARIADNLARALKERRTLLEPCGLTLFFSGQDGHDFAAFVNATKPLRDVDMHLIEVFCANIALSASNIDLLARLREYAFVDRLLGLPNRAALIDQVDAALRKPVQSPGVLALLDIDQFAETNDMFGHVYGDLLLAAIARRLSDNLPPHCLVARVAADTFGIWGAETDVEPERLAGLFERPFQIEGVERLVSLSMGLVRQEDGQGSGQDMYKNAAIALKQAKASGHGGSQYYTPMVGVAIRERTRLLQGLQSAFDRERLFVVYQPQLALDSGRTVGAEALLRWRTDEGHFVSPAQFIPVAEQSGLIVPIGAWVLRTALHALRTLRARGTTLRMAVNVSPLQFAQPHFLALLDEALQEAAVPPGCLELEITESVAVMGLDRVAELLAQVKARGVAIAIDDFGTGFSSLSYLDRLPADRLKIDRTFVSALDSGRAGARIAELIVPLGHRLGMQVVAEGVENAAQVAALRQLGCNEVQGYLYARPMPFDAFAAWLAPSGHTP